MDTNSNEIEPEHLKPWMAKIRASLLKQPPEIPDESMLSVLSGYYWETGRIPECLSCVRLMEQREAASSHELDFRGYWQLYTGDAASALKTFSAALEQDRHDFATRLGYAYALFYLLDYKSAGTLFQKLYDDGAPLHSPPIMAAACRALAAGQRPAEIQMAPIPGLPPGLADVLQIKLLNGTDAAILNAQALQLRLSPKERLPIGRLLVELYLDEGRDKEALDVVDELRKTHASDGPLLFFNGLALRRLGKLKESQDCFSKAVEFGPLDARFWGALGAGWIELGEHQKALEAYGVAIFLDNENPHFWGDLGTLESLLEQYEKARESLSKSIELGLVNFSNYFNRGICALNLEDIDAAVRDWQLAIAAEPNHPRVPEVKALLEEAGGEGPDNRFVFGDIQ